MGKDVRTKKYFAMFKDLTGYFISNYSEETIHSLEEDKKRIKNKFNAEFIYSGEIKNRNQKLGVELEMKRANDSKSKLNIQKLEDILKNDD